MSDEEHIQYGSRRRGASAPISRSQLEQHFEGVAATIRAQFGMASGLSPVMTGGAREWAVQKFLQEHLPGSVGVGTGHVLYGTTRTSKQQDLVVYRNSSLALPIGNCGLFLPEGEGVIACIEVKSTLTATSLTDVVASNFASLEDPQPLKVLIAGQLADDYRYRNRIGEWVDAANLPPTHLPDLLIVCNVGTVVRGNSLRTLTGFIPSATDASRLYKYGSYGKNVEYGEQVWVGFALLAFEIADRATNVNWSEYLHSVLPTEIEAISGNKSV